MSALKSPVQYFGAKQHIAEQLVALMPAHMGYLEPHAGSLSVLLAKPESKIEVVNDLDERLMNFWRVLRDRPDELLHVAEFTPHSRAELEGAAALDGDTELELARQVWVLLTQGRSRTMKRIGWRFYVDPRGTNGSFSTYMRAYRSRLLPAAERLQNVSLESRPALEVIEKYGAHADNLLYVDPPYVHSTRRGARYTHEMTEADHREMAASLRKTAAVVMLSGYASPLYDELFGDWYKVQSAPAPITPSIATWSRSCGRTALSATSCGTGRCSCEEPASRRIPGHAPPRDADTMQAFVLQDPVHMRPQQGVRLPPRGEPMTTTAVFEQIRERDGGFCLLVLPGCLGEGNVPHHRANRGSGGSKVLDDPRVLALACSICNGRAEDASAIVRADLIRRGLRVEKAATNAQTLQRCIDTPVECLDGERFYLVSATERRHISEGRPS